MESLAVRRATHRGIVAVVGGASSGSADTVGSVTTSVMPLLDTAVPLADDRDGDWPGQATDAKFDGAAGSKASCRVVDGERLRTATGVPRCA